MIDSIPVRGICEPRFHKVRDLFQHSFESGEEIGAAVSFVLDGKCVVDLWGGHYDLARSREWELDTLVNVYSTTKAMTALCAIQLMERGLLDIEAPVSQYWPEFAAAGKEAITIRWLLSHRAGLCAVRAPLQRNSLYDWERMCDALAAQEPWWTPGDGHGYHAFTFGFLVGELVRRVTGESVGAFFRKNVAQPLGADFHIGLDAGNDARTSDMYSVQIGNKPAPVRTQDDPMRSMTGAFAEFGRRMQDTTTMQWAAFRNPTQDRDAVNTRAWRAAEIPAVNGHGTARALARIYGALARGGEIDGVRILQPQSIVRATAEECSGPERLFCGAVPMRFGLGFVLSDETHRYARLSPNPRAFGHAGGGGSLGMADPDHAIGFGFTMNHMHASIVSAGATPTVLIDAFYEALSRGS
ncbi:MAG: beta-lactamase family protein [Proteobacteria bacterium]|nr:beta-lactamase family protein [Pseudomonadota bacterium]